MTIDEREISDFVANSDAVLVNLGTMDRQRARAIELAVESANGRSKPWVLDPVMIDRSKARLAQARELVGCKPLIVRGNAREIETLARCCGETHAIGLAARLDATVVQTGPQDFVCSAAEAVIIDNGHPLMDSVTGMGCAAGAVIAAYAVLNGGAFAASWRAALTFAVAGEIAAAGAEGPGSLQPRLLDVLNHLDGATIVERARIRELQRDEFAVLT